MSREPYSKDNPYSRELTPTWDGWVALWKMMMAHLNTYGQPPHYRRAAAWLQAGGIMSGKKPEDFPV